jgi:hypothetical protein
MTWTRFEEFQREFVPASGIGEWVTSSSSTCGFPWIFVPFMDPR